MALPDRSGKKKTTTPADETKSTKTQEPTVEELKAQIAAMEAEKRPEAEKLPAEEEAPKEVAVVNKPAAGDVVVSDGTVMPSIMSLKNAMDPETFGNTFPRLVGANGNLSCDGVKFGSFVDVQVYSHSARSFVVPVSEQSDKEARKYCRASYDGKTIPGRDETPEMTIEEYTDSQAGGYTEWSVKKYYDIYCIIFNAEKEASKGEAIGFIQVSVSPTAVKLFNAFTMQAALFIARGQMKATHQNCMRITGDLMENDDKKEYVRMSFSPCPAEVIAEYTPVLMA